MPNFNPYETGSLMNLLSSLHGGLSGDTGWSVLQSILGEQQSRVAARQDRMRGLTDLLAGQATEGQTPQGSSALADGYTRKPCGPPQMQDVPHALYPMETIQSNVPYTGPRPGVEAI